VWGSSPRAGEFARALVSWKHGASPKLTHGRQQCAPYSVASERIIVEVMGDEPSGRRWRPAAALALLVAVTATVGVLIAIVQRPASHAPIRPTPIPSPFPFPTPPATQAPLSVDLSGTWAGECTGPFNGFCSLTLMQTANTLHVTFMLSSPPDNLHTSGKLTGSTISFGAVGVVTFTGTLSGSTLSGSYTDIANGISGSWSVTLSP
jgi:hypothetical protein